MNKFHIVYFKDRNDFVEQWNAYMKLQDDYLAALGLYPGDLGIATEARSKSDNPLISHGLLYIAEQHRQVFEST
jgi:hypothetical protein